MQNIVRFVVLNLRMGGQVSAVLALVQALQQQGDDADFLLPDGAKSASKADLDRYIRRAFWQRLTGVWRLLRTLRQRMDPKRAILHLILPSPAFAWLTLLVNYPSARIVLQYEGPVTSLDRQHRRAFWEDPLLLLPRLVLNHRLWAWGGRFLTVAHLAIGTEAAKELRSLGFKRVFAAVNFTHFAADDRLNPLEIPADFAGSAQRLLGYVGHAFSVKGVDDLLAAFAIACQKADDLRLLLAFSGEGSQRRMLKLVNRLGIEAKVWMVGLVPVKQVLQRLDGLVLPYRTAITTTLFPSLLLEADAVGCPVITTDIPAWNEIFDKTSADLYVVEPRNIEALAAAMVQLPKRRDRRVQPFLRLPTTSARIQKIRAIYQQVVQSNATQLPHET